MNLLKKTFLFLLVIVLVFLSPSLAKATPPTPTPTPNAAPVLITSQTPTFASIYKNAGAPEGAVGTLVSSLVDFTVPSGAVDNVTDANSGALLGIAITGVDGADLSCYFSINNGITWLSFGPVSDESSRLLAANATNRVYCNANAPDVTGTFSAFSFRAWDQTTGTSGSTADTSTNGLATAFSSDTDTASLSIITHPPQATNLSAAETYRKNTALDLTDIVVSDLDSETLTVTLTLSTEAAGTLNEDTSGEVTSNFDEGVWTASGAKADVNTLLAGLIFTPATDFTGAFTISTRVSDETDSVTGSKAFTRTTVPIAITNCTDLQNIKNHLDESYLIQADTIDCDGVNFQPVGTSTAPFTGTLDGNDKTILNLTISTTTNMVGLFGKIQGATIQDLTLSSGSVTGHVYTGLLAGFATAPNTLSNITSSINVTGTDVVGGLIGATENGTGTTTLSNVHVNATITGHNSVGGIVGDIEGNTLITQSSVEGAVSSSQYIAGGLIGYGISTTIDQSFSTASVTTPSNKCCTGGLVGELDVNSYVTDSYSTGVIHGGSSTGGVVGEDDAGTFTNVYAIGEVSTPVGDHGGLNAFGGGTFINSFWDIGTTDQVTSFDGIGTTTLAMKRQSTYTDWSFDSIWGIDSGLNNGYPFLSWQTFAPSKVTGLSATAENPNKITLSWTAPAEHNSSITGYKIERKLAADGEWSTLIADTASSTTTYDDTTVLPNTEYNYRVSALSAAGAGAVSDTADATTPVLSSGTACVPDAYWKFDEGSGTTAVESVQGQNGTLVESPTYSSDVPPVLFSDSYSLLFNEDLQKMTFLKSATTTYSISMWIKPLGQPNDHGALMFQNSEKGLYYLGNGQNKLSNYFGEAGDHAGTTTLTLETWHHVALVNNAGHATLYLDGVADGTMEDSPAVDFNTLGSDANPEPFKGYIDDVREYDSVLTASDVEVLAGGDENCAVSEPTPTPSPVLRHGSTGGGSVSSRIANLLAMNKTQEALNLAKKYQTSPQNASNPSPFIRDLKFGMSGDDVKQLQIFLNTHGYPVALTGLGSSGNETDYFGALTKLALIKFQEANAKYILVPHLLKKGTGFFGPTTRGFINSILLSKAA